MIVVDFITTSFAFIFSAFLFLLAARVSRRVAVELDDHFGQWAAFLSLENPAMFLMPVNTALAIILTPPGLLECGFNETCGIGQRLGAEALLGVSAAVMFVAITVIYLLARSRHRPPSDEPDGKDPVRKLNELIKRAETRGSMERASMLRLYLGRIENWRLDEGDPGYFAFSARVRAAVATARARGHERFAIILEARYCGIPE